MTMASAPLSITRRRFGPAWSACTFVILASAAAILFWPTTSSLLGEWSDGENLSYTHGYLVAAVALGLLIRVGLANEGSRSQPDYCAAIALTATSVFWLVAYRAGLQIVHQVLLPLIGWLAVWAALGFAAGRRTAFAFGFLYFAIPLWSAGNFLLQHLTVVAVRVLLQVAGIGAFVADTSVHIPAGVFEIAGGCSGLHFFVVAVAIAALYGEIHGDTARARVLLIALAASIAIVTNWVRVFTIIVAGHVSGMQHPLIHDHYLFGWMLFAVAIGLFLFGTRWLPLEARQAVPVAEDMKARGFPLLGIIAALAAMMAGPLWSTVMGISEQSRESIQYASTLPSDLGSWHGSLLGSRSWRPSYPSADGERQIQYQGSTGVVDVYIASYAYQRQGKELIGYGNTLINRDTESAIAQRLVEYDGSSINEIEVREPNGNDALIWFEYQIGSRRFQKPLAAQLYYGLVSLWHTPISRIVALRTACAPNCDAARRRLADLQRTLHASPT